MPWLLLPCGAESFPSADTLRPEAGLELADKKLSMQKIMKTQSSKFVLLLSLLGLAVWAVGPTVSAQIPPSLGLQFSAGHSTLSLTGGVGIVYSIQYANDFSQTNPWVDRTLLQAQGASNVWTDPAPTSGQRFYRAVSVAAPADTNLVFIQPGTFRMGSPTSEAFWLSNETQHTVTISRGFWMEKFLVTQGDYLAVVGINPSYFNGVRNGTDYGTDLTRPVEEVSWIDATNYCAIRTQQERAEGLIPTNYVYRLPTESEREYTGRAGTTTAFCLGRALRSGQANFNGQGEYDASLGTISNPNGIYLQTTTPVGSYAANGWGLYDMIGNVAEWCQDWYGTYPGGIALDPQGPATGSFREIRGGYWDFSAWECRSAARDGYPPTFQGNYIGFRVLLASGQ
jgi:formylglycine-generating enzyme required for sulfatase activity